MDKRKDRRKENKRSWRRFVLHGRKGLALLLIFAMVLCGCGKTEGISASGEMVGEKGAGVEEAEAGTAMPEEADGSSGVGGEAHLGTAIAGETSEDTVIDFEALQSENPDIFAWLYVPGTGIDAPVLQSAEADDYYESHNAYGEPDLRGALYTELANLKNMCDFNTVIHGKSGENGLFEGLYQFADPDFFEEHEEIYLYLDGNLLTYTVFAAYERENASLIRSYDFTYGSGCEKFLADMYGSREMGKNLREGWEEVTPYHFLVTLTAEEEHAEKQFVVLAALTGDAAGTIDRTVEW
ncbi:MAG: class B sortase [Lachnospiraceae bacterium]|nr:class B sortase [Lachnospiraceae bacterium]